MKKKTTVILLSIIEIIALILFIATFKVAFSKTIESFINGLMSHWGQNTKEIIITPREKFLIKINSITPYIFFISLIIRFIFTNKKGRIAISVMLSIICISLVLTFGNSSIYIPAIPRLIIAIMIVIVYIYSHIVYFKDNIKVKR